MKYLKVNIHALRFRYVFCARSSSLWVGYSAYGKFTISSPPVNQRKRVMRSMWKKLYRVHRSWNGGEEP